MNEPIVNEKPLKSWNPPNKQTELQKILNVIATRKSYTGIAQLMAYLPNPDLILEKINQEIDVYKQLKTDPHISACIQSRKSGIMGLLWSIDRGTEPTEQSEFIKGIFKHLDIESIINSILDAPSIGYKPLEVMWQLKDDKIIPIAVIGKPAEWFVFDNENLLRFKIRGQVQGELMPARKFLVAKFNPTYENPYGEGFLSKCWWSWTFKKGAMKFWVRFMEKYGMPMLIGKYDRNLADDSAKSELFEQLDAGIQDNVSIVPNDTDIAMLDTSKASSPAIFQDYAHFCNSEISKAILSQTLTTEQGETGSYAMSQTHLEVRQDVVDSDKRMVETTLNTFIKWIIDYNYTGVIDYPKFILYKPTDVDQNLATRDRTLWDSGWVKPTQKYINKAYEFEEGEMIVIEKATAKGVLEPDVTGIAPPENQVITGGIPTPVIPQEPFDELAIPKIEPIKDDTNFDINTFSFNELNNIQKEMLKPAQDLIDSSQDQDELRQGLPKLYPHLKDDGVSDFIMKLLIAGQVGGAVEVSKKLQTK